MDRLADLIYWSLIGYGWFCGFMLALSSLDKILCRYEEKQWERKHQEERQRLKEFEKKHQQSPNASIVEQGMFVARSKEELDKMFDQIGKKPNIPRKKLHHKTKSNSIHAEVEVI